MSAAHRNRGGSGGRSAPGLMRSRISLMAAAFMCMAATTPVRAQDGAGILQLALVIPVASAPLFTSDGAPARDADARVTALADALDALLAPELDDVPFALAPSAVLCDELVQLGRRGRRLRNALEDVSTRVRALPARLVTAPYADVRLPDLTSTSAISNELRQGRERLDACGDPNRNVLLPPDLALDNDTVAAIAKSGVTVALAPADRVRRGPTRSQGLIFVPTSATEPGDSPNDAYLRVQGFESVVALVPPDRQDLATFIMSLADDPRVRLSSISDLVSDPSSRSVAFPSIAPPPASYRHALDSAASALRRLRSFTLPRNHLVEVLRTSVARARSTAEWDGRWSIGRTRARDVVRAVARQQRSVSSADGSVTFTSQRGSVPVTVTNATTYPVRVRVALASTKLEFPDGPTRVVTIDPPGDTVVFAALARSSGTFPVQVRVTSADGRLAFNGGELTVRSTAANVPALALTAGGALFLIGWYVRHLRRRHRQRAAPG